MALSLLHTPSGTFLSLQEQAFIIMPSGGTCTCLTPCYTQQGDKSFPHLRSHGSISRGWLRKSFVLVMKLLCVWPWLWLILLHPRGGWCRGAKHYVSLCLWIFFCVLYLLIEEWTQHNVPVCLRDHFLFKGPLFLPVVWPLLFVTDSSLAQKWSQTTTTTKHYRCPREQHIWPKTSVFNFLLKLMLSCPLPHVWKRTTKLWGGLRGQSKHSADSVVTDTFDRYQDPLRHREWLIPRNFWEVPGWRHTILLESIGKVNLHNLGPLNGFDFSSPKMHLLTKYTVPKHTPHTVYIGAHPCF